jgi:hypothetical protein
MNENVKAMLVRSLPSILMLGVAPIARLYFKDRESKRHHELQLARIKAGEKA